MMFLLWFDNKIVSAALVGIASDWFNSEFFLQIQENLNQFKVRSKKE